jgi:photosystem II stability/assembly factor-like uncharacterized protein
VFKSTDAGTTWSETALTLATVQVIAVDPLLASTVIAGTTSGLFVSRSGGATWAEESSFSGADVRALLLDARTPSRQYVACRGRGILRSDDEGSTWRTASDGLPNLLVTDLAADAFDPDTLYAAVEEAGLFKSTDGGGSWVPLRLSAMFPTALAVDPGESSQVLLGLSTGDLFAVENGGEGWVRIGDGLTGSAITAVGVGPAGVFVGDARGDLFRSTNHGGTFGHLAHLPGCTSLTSDPTDGATIYAGTMAGVFKTQDMGTHWKACNSGLPSGCGDGSCITVHEVAADRWSLGRLFAATTLGLFSTADGGGTWLGAVLDPDRSQPEDVRSVAIDPSASTSVYAVTHDGGAYRSTDNGGHWTALEVGSPAVPLTCVVVNPKHPNVVYAGSFGRGVLRSTNGGETWNPFNNGLPTNFVQTLAPSHDGTRVYAGTEGLGLYVVEIAGQDSLNVSMRAEPRVGPAPLAVVFSATAAGGTPPFSFDWDFGDASSHSTAPMPTHVFVRPGIYTVTLSVGDSAGDTVLRSVMIDSRSRVPRRHLVRPTPTRANLYHFVGYPAVAYTVGE